MNKPPLQRDENYSAEWPDISTLGIECKGLDGTYANEGIYYDEKGAQHAILLTSIIPQNSHPQANAVSLKVVTGKMDANHDSTASLQITIGDDKKCLGSFYLKQALFYSPGSSGGGLPPVAV